MTTRRATVAAFGAILLWALLAWFTTLSGDVPPLQLLAMCFALGGGAGAALTLWRGGVAAWRQPIRVWIVGVGGLFGYHLLYVLALRSADPVAASLIAYLWPLLIVLGATRVSGQALRWHHLVGAAAGAIGAALVVTGGRGVQVETSQIAGYALALAAACVWASYSLLSRRMAEVPTDAVSGFCLGTAMLSGLAHLALEVPVMPSATEWLAILGLGFGPVGLAFFLWDLGMKRGDMAVLGAASYAAPLLSTLILVAVGRAEASWTLALACILITGGAALAARDMLGARPAA
ncbi:membrane protein [Jannaschia pagri]|uniref:Membrane protein n=1 Tax=Jannaschia pagri TaxID=2829797 RepID=A0ABQ4NM71_9RHOB|nr:MULTISPECIES: EamA family transporter [unclassified Jannaschia]GIT91660.1 membrane protein [Jannaschia sp. AI_61]GIT95494.1 membrane protein [Jannaschia sp. AI_62]